MKEENIEHSVIDKLVKFKNEFDLSEEEEKEIDEFISYIAKEIQSIFSSIKQHNFENLKDFIESKIKEKEHV